MVTSDEVKNLFKLRDEDDCSIGSIRLAVHSHRGRAAGMELSSTVAKLGQLRFQGRIYK